MIGYIDAANRASLALHEAFGFRGRLSALDRLQVRSLDRHRHGPALAGPGRDRAAAGVTRRAARARYRLGQTILSLDPRTPSRGINSRRVNLRLVPSVAAIYD